MNKTIVEVENGQFADGMAFRRMTLRHPQGALPVKKAYHLGDGTVAFSKRGDAIRFTSDEWHEVLINLFAPMSAPETSAGPASPDLVDILPDKAADAVGVTPHSDMRPFVVRAVKWALRTAIPPKTQAVDAQTGGIRMFPITREQRRAIYLKWRQADQGLSYRAFRMSAIPVVAADGAIALPWCGMWLCIEADGYTHS